MKYMIFQPKLGTYAEAETLGSAQAKFAELVADYAATYTPRPCEPGDYLYNQSLVADLVVAAAFMCAKRGMPALTMAQPNSFLDWPIRHTHSVFNLTTGTHWSRTFEYLDGGNRWHIKVKDGQVTDWYQHGASVGGVTYEWVTYDLVTGDPFEVYTLVDAHTVSKTTLSNLQSEPVTTHFGDPADYPDFVVAALSGFAHRASVFAWSQKSYGLVVEYLEPTLVPEDEWPADVAARNAQARQKAAADFLVEARAAVAVNACETDGEDEVWTLLDTSDWPLTSSPSSSE